ncbi:hypothetical protein IAR55_001090 [Kwoniella newhampshirensis]|uniref:Zn(2)-C6 fungal-type domain-containing protein n=1 Tax=Kwoniella newhampshirensis TaxID=1651941 RepID=A0AAW0Z5F8_9TREE
MQPQDQRSGLYSYYPQSYSISSLTMSNEPHLPPPEDSPSLSTSRQSYDMSFPPDGLESQSIPTQVGEYRVGLEGGEEYGGPSGTSRISVGQDDVYRQEAFEEAGDVGRPPTLRRRITDASSPTESLGEGLMESRDDSGRGDSPKKKPRITLPRGRACVPCRKCSGDRPCRNCDKNGTDCRYEELQRKKPKTVMLEERVTELEALLKLRPGQNLPRGSYSDQSAVGYTELSTPSEHSMSIEARLNSAESHHTPPFFGNQGGPGPPVVSLLSFRDMPPNMAAVNTAVADVPPNSHLEMALIQVVLPYSPHLLMPVHPARFLTLLALPPNNPNRPHPAFLYILFFEAVRVLEKQVPLPNLPPPPPSLFPPSFDPPIPPPCLAPDYILSQVGGTSASLLERARTELDEGIRNVDRPFDLARAAIGIARAMYSLGRFIEGWNIPVMRLVTSCGLHRITGEFVPPAGSSVSGTGGPELMPPQYAPSYQYRHPHVPVHISPGQQPFPILRMKPVIIPPARDEIEVAERVMTFWAAKKQDWESGIGWGWSMGLADEQVTTKWAWGWGQVEVRHPNSPAQQFSICDLYDPMSPMHSSPEADTTYVLALKSAALLHRASSLFDLPISSIPISQPDGRIESIYRTPLPAIESVETALRLFRGRIPPPFVYGRQAPNPPVPGQMGPIAYDGFSDPWWITLHANIYTAEMLMYREMANHRPEAYETAVSRARALVDLSQKVPLDAWANVDMLVALDLSFASRFLFKETNRLMSIGQTQAAGYASEEAEMLCGILRGPYTRWLHIASLHSLIIQRVREGWSEKEGEYERV